MKQTLQTNVAMNDFYDARSSVIQTIQCNVGLKFFSILPKCLFVIIVMYAYFIDILQGNVETHLQCGGICNNHIIANCLQVCQWKNFENRSIIGEDMDKNKVARFTAYSVYRVVQGCLMTGRRSSWKFLL